MLPDSRFGISAGMRTLIAGSCFVVEIHFESHNSTASVLPCVYSSTATLIAGSISATVGRSETPLTSAITSRR